MRAPCISVCAAVTVGAMDVLNTLKITQKIASPTLTTLLSTLWTGAFGMLEV